MPVQAVRFDAIFILKYRMAVFPRILPNPNIRHLKQLLASRLTGITTRGDNVTAKARDSFGEALER